MRIFMREDPTGRRNWRQYLAITDGQVVLVEMTPAVFGWNFGRITIQGAEDWSDMSADQIIAWKHETDPLLIAVPEPSTVLLEKLERISAG